MSVIITAAILTVVVVVFLLAPLMLGSKRQQLQAWVLLMAITAGAMGLYLWRGAPDTPSAPALFEKAGANFEKRALIRKEAELERQLAANPDDTRLMLSLGEARLQNGHIDEAIAVLDNAYRRDPGNNAIRLKLGAAHYAADFGMVV